MSSVKDLKAILKLEKAKGNFKGNFSTLKKPELIAAVSSLGFAVTPAKRGRVAAPKMFGPSLKSGMSYTNIVKKYQKRGNKQLNAAIALSAPKVVKPRAKVVRPALKRGMSYKKLVSDYEKFGNLQLAAALPYYPIGQPPPNRPLPMVPANMNKAKKRRGRPKGSKNKPKN